MEFPVQAGKAERVAGHRPRVEVRAARSWPARTAASSPTRRAGPASPTFMNTPAVLRRRDRRAGRHRRRRGRWPGSTRRWPPARSSCRGPSVERFRTEQVCGRDAVMGVPTRWAVGYSLEPPALVPGAPPMHGPNEGAFGHMGAGGQIGFADPVARVGCGFVRNHLENQALPLMGACLVDVLYSCLGDGGKGAAVYAAEHAAEHPDQPAIVMAPSGRTLTFAEYEAGGQPGGAPPAGRRACAGGTTWRSSWRTTPPCSLTEAGAERTGLYFTPVNSYLSAEEVAYIVNDSQSRVVVTSAAKAEVARAAPGAVPQRRALDHGRRRRRRRGGPFESWEEAVGCATDGPCRGRTVGRAHDVLVGDDGATQGDPAPHVRHPPVRDQHRRARHRRRCGASARAWCTCRRRRCTTPPRR